MNELLKEIVNRCQSEYDDMVAIRRDIHMHPEIKFEGGLRKPPLLSKQPSVAST
ncbi:MAG: hypothetical protein JRH15_20205 [Deltaproteobacteria bacterium]|nr:hypothetical protein [Deltaproteobacteria bacterium]